MDTSGSKGESMSLVVYGSLEGFRNWLDFELFRRFGRAASNRSICIKAGLPENALYRVLTKGERPSSLFCERMAKYLGLSLRSWSGGRGYARYSKSARTATCTAWMHS